MFPSFCPTFRPPPTLFDREVAHHEWHGSCLASYVERDVRQISRIADLLKFQRFRRIMAPRSGQLLNLNAVANDLGIAQTTSRDWLAVLEASYIVFRLPPYHTNFELKSGATFPREWLRPFHTLEKHAAAARRGSPMLISATPGNAWQEGVMTAYWRDAMKTLA